MATEKQIEANRENALKSTGPKTEEGKAKFAQNGSRYRKLAETVLLQSENPKIFTVFARRFYLEHQPKGPTERLLLNIMMIVAAWRLMRLSTMEAAGVDREYETLLKSNTPGHDHTHPRQHGLPQHLRQLPFARRPQQHRIPPSATVR